MKYLIVTSVLLAALYLVVHFIGLRARKLQALALLRLLKSDNPDVQLASLESLAAINHPIARMGLLNAATIGAPRLRRAAVRCLQVLGRQAIKSIEELGPHRAPASLGYHITYLLIQRRAVRQLDKYVIPALIAALDDSNPRVRQAAIGALTDLDTLEARAALVKGTQMAGVDGIWVSTYCPEELGRELWHPLYVYVFREYAANATAMDVESLLTGETPSYYRSLDQPLFPISVGTLLSAKPRIPNFIIEPSVITATFSDDWHRFDFQLKATDALVSGAYSGSVTIEANGIIISEIPLSLQVAQVVERAQIQEVTQRIYQSIFCSYSHDDKNVVRRVESAYKALGLAYYRDTETLRSGEDWSDALRQTIDRADIFQLFWSHSAAHSKAVEQEWKYALTLKRQFFIRPVYWEHPMPHPPPELAQTHFSFRPELAEVQSGKGERA